MHFPVERYVADHSAWVGSFVCSSLLAGGVDRGPGAADASDGSLRPRARARRGEKVRCALGRVDADGGGTVSCCGRDE